MKTYFYLACFDVQDDKLRRLVVKELLEYGCRVQGSVFELAIAESDLNQLTQKLKSYCDDFDDPANIRFYRISRRDLQYTVALDEAKIMDFVTYKVL